MNVDKNLIITQTAPCETKPQAHKEKNLNASTQNERWHHRMRWEISGNPRLLLNVVQQQRVSQRVFQLYTCECHKSDFRVSQLNTRVTWGCGDACGAVHIFSKGIYIICMHGDAQSRAKKRDVHGGLDTDHNRRRRGGKLPLLAWASHQCHHCHAFQVSTPF